MDWGIFVFEGRKIKAAAKFLFVVGIIEALVLAFYFGWDITPYGRKEFVAWRFFLVLIGGIIVNYIRCLLLSGIGSLIEDVSGRRYDMECVKKDMTDLKKSVQSIEEEMTKEAE